jgi:N-methylhydantoinase A
VTDANLVLGYLDPANFLGGRRSLDLAAATGVVATLAASLGIETEAAAAGIHRVVNSRMADGVRVATVRRGVDPRGFTLLAFGGAAGLHVTAVAAELGIARVAVPVAASVLSAWGMLKTDLRVEVSRGQSQAGGIDTGGLTAAFAAMEAEGRARLGWFDGVVTTHRSADMRYGEQVFEIAVPLDDVDWEAPALPLAAALADRFHAAHERLYTYALQDQEVVLVNARLSVIGRLAQVDGLVTKESGADAGPKTERAVYLNGWTRVPVFDFGELAAEQVVRGPAIVESDTTTILLRNGDTGRFDARGWLDITI